jgi:probable phosphoglycerate mutase
VELYLVRHAAFVEDAETWRRDPPLSEPGRAQAAAVAARLAAVRFDRCLVSPLARAQETARAFTTDRNVALETHACLVEGELGALDGLGREEARRRYPEYFRLGHTVLPRLAATGRTAPAGETRAEFLERARVALALVREPLFDPTARALVVSHGGLLAYLIALLLGHEPRDEAAYAFDYCSVARVESYREAPAYGPFAVLRFSAP